jgi:hypothetical protein
MDTLVELSAETGALHETESEMISEIIKLGDKTARDCMTPRVDMFALPDNLTNEQAIVQEGSMRKKTLTFLALAFFALAVLPGAICQAQAEKSSYPAASYPAMAPLDQYLIPDVNSEITLARSGAPASISDAAEVMVLGAKGYTTAAKGTNGFLCIVERSWGAATDEPEFWNPKVRAPICFNPAAARTFVPIFLMKTKLVLAGKSKRESSRPPRRHWTKMNCARWSPARCATCSPGSST